MAIKSTADQTKIGRVISEGLLRCDGIASHTLRQAAQAVEEAAVLENLLCIEGCMQTAG